MHPDRNPSDDAKEKFQQLQKVYAVLSDPDKCATILTCLERERSAVFNYLCDLQSLAHLLAISALCGDAVCFRRKLYDRTGSLEDAEEMGCEDFKAMYEYFKTQVELVRCPPVTCMVGL